MKPNKDYYAPMHTAEHILNQAMIRTYKCELSYSNHIERKKSKCDFHFDHALSAEEVSSLEEQVNAVIKQGLDISEDNLSFDEANKSYKLGKIPSNTTESIRIIKIGDYDARPCIGKHVSNTSEIGDFTISTTNFEAGVLRVRYKLKFVKQENES